MQQELILDNTASRIKKLTRILANQYPGDVSATPEFVRALAFLNVSIRPETIIAAGYVLAVPVGILTSICLIGGIALIGTPLSPRALCVVLLLSGAIGVGVTYLTQTLPIALATLRRTRALGAAPGLVGRIGLRLQLDGPPERASAFAARTGTGPLAESLQAHVDQTNMGPTAGLMRFASEWKPWFRPLERSLTLLRAAVDTPPADRTDVIESGIDAVLSGIRSTTAGFAGTVRGPASGLYAFGVLLPLALVGVLPAARAGGVSIPTGAFVLFYDFLLPIGLLTASGWILLQRPVAFAPTQIPRSHPALPAGSVRGIVAASAGALIGWGIGSTVVPWGGPIAACGIGVGAGLTVQYHPAAAVRKQVADIESGLADATAVIGRRVGAGEAVETSLTAAADATIGETSTVFKTAAGVQHRLRVDIQQAFLGPYGALSDVPSDRARATAVLIGVAAREGRPAGETLQTLADHLRTVQQTESAARRELASITGTLSHTAALFGPLVGGATVSMATKMAEASGSTDSMSATTGPALGPSSQPPTVGSTVSGATAIPPEILGIAVGIYILLLAAILTILATGLEQGLERSLVGYRVGLALLSGTATYFTAYIGAIAVF